MSQRAFFNTLLVLATIAAISGAIALLLRPDSNPGLEIILPTATPTPELKVFVTGAVQSPGVYTLQEGNRVEDAVNAAGGLLPDADISAVNMAKRVGDEEHFHIPRVGEAPLVASEAQEEPEDSRIDINIASQSLLQTLPGIGEVRAKAIVDYRESQGPFQFPADITNVDGIGQGTYENIRDLIRAGPGAP